jgi:hypothetical protein
MNREKQAPAAGRLRHGNPSGNPRAAPRCGALTRAGEPCRAPAMANGSCRCHGGRRAGPATGDGVRWLRDVRAARGFYGRDGRAFRHTVAALFAQGRWLRLMAEVRRVAAAQDTGAAGGEDSG